MIAVVESRQFCQAFLIRHAKGFTQRCHIRFHLSGKLCLADAADGGILVEHADIIEVVELAEDAELRELGNAGDESELQIWVEHFQRTIEVLHDATERLQILLLVHHVQQRGIIFIDDDYRLLARLLVSFLHQIFQTEIGIHLMRLIPPDGFLLFKHISQISFQLLHVHVLGTAQVEVEYRVLHPILLVISNGQSFEKLLSSLEISLKGRGKKRLAESSWTTQEDIRHLLFSEIHDVLGLVYIEITFLADLFKSLYPYGIFIYYFCHNPTCFTFCAAKLQRKSELTKHNG